MQKYKHIFFDLDHTLYDFDKSTRQTFKELYEKYGLQTNGVPDFDDFMVTYFKNNLRLWAEYREGMIKKKFLHVERFHVSFLYYGIDDRDFATRFANEYLKKTPLNKALFPGAIEVLEYLKPKYKLHIITNGFEEIQKVKMESNDLNRFFETVTTSEEAGANKPDAAIYHYAMQKASAKADESMMIGDDPDVDILGARLVGMDQILFLNNGDAHSSDCTFTIRNLKEILTIL
jgi:putative hydrolase of the HAD superfamily